MSFGIAKRCLHSQKFPTRLYITSTTLGLEKDFAFPAGAATTKPTTLLRGSRSAEDRRQDAVASQHVCEKLGFQIVLDHKRDDGRAHLTLSNFCSESRLIILVGFSSFSFGSPSARTSRFVFRNMNSGLYSVWRSLDRTGTDRVLQHASILQNKAFNLGEVLSKQV